MTREVLILLLICMDACVSTTQGTAWCRQMSQGIDRLELIQTLRNKGGRDLTCEDQKNLSDLKRQYEEMQCEGTLQAHKAQEPIK